MLVTIRKTNNAVCARNRAGIFIYLRENNWDDYGYKTLFHLSIEDEHGKLSNIGDLKIGYSTQPINTWTSQAIIDGCDELIDGFFSVGQDASYYQNLSALPQVLRDTVLTALKDVVKNSILLAAVSEFHVFKTSLLRGIAISSVLEQFPRVLNGGAVLTPFHFGYMKAQSENNAGVQLEFLVTPESIPSTNIHVLIGRNGIGKTTLLNNMISCLVDGFRPDIDVGNFYDLQQTNPPINNRYFTSIISASFSAFDPFTPPFNRNAEIDDVRYTYVGLKEIIQGPNGRISRHKDIHELASDFWTSLNSCFSLVKKKERWLSAIGHLSSDLNFSEMQLGRLAEEPSAAFQEKYARQFFSRMSSGHAVVILTLTKLVESLEEKTLLLMDEPESHLHPPLLSAFLRAVSVLLNNRNGVAIIATHSPVILQEVPKSCVWKLRRTRLILNADRPDDETFGENVGTLTRDVFGLEVSNSGFHNLLKEQVDRGWTFEQIVEKYNGQIGFEGKALLRSLISNRGV